MSDIEKLRAEAENLRKKIRVCITVTVVEFLHWLAGYKLKCQYVYILHLRLCAVAPHPLLPHPFPTFISKYFLKDKK